ncbi:FMN-binding negative transcriptional regulator [Streptomyces flaveolus]|uniref:FMN-binding negative transcriptional regulator n=1 Tax=Streptomyces flaveolus TaxID=67297 RepID=UPI003F540072
MHDGPAWIETQIRRLTDRHEAGNDEPWSVDRAPAEFIERQPRVGVGVGVELVISRVEAKVKLSQNQPRENVEGIIAGAEARDRSDAAVAAAVRAHEPHATTV